MKHLIHIASGAPVKVGQCIFDRRTGEKHIITRVPEHGAYLGYRTDRYCEISHADAGVMLKYPHRTILYHESSVEYAGLTFKVKFPRDDCGEASWERGDGYGTISDTTDRAKRPGERVIGNVEYGRRRLYDWQGTIAKAKAEGWNHEPYTGTKGERAARAVQADFEFHEAWLKNEWEFVGIEIECTNAEGFMLGEDTCWGFETWKDYHEEAAWEMIEALAVQVKKEQAAALEAERVAAEQAEAERQNLQEIAKEMWAYVSYIAPSRLGSSADFPAIKRRFNLLCAKAGVAV